jgi:hypothetical protein
MSGGEVAVLQAPIFDGLSLDLSRCLMIAAALPKEASAGVTFAGHSWHR